VPAAKRRRYQPAITRIWRGSRPRPSGPRRRRRASPPRGPPHRFSAATISARRGSRTGGPSSRRSMVKLGAKSRAKALRLTCEALLGKKIAGVDDRTSPMRPIASMAAPISTGSPPSAAWTEMLSRCATTLATVRPGPVSGWRLLGGQPLCAALARCSMRVWRRRVSSSACR
jgi:hypothetical protein